MIEVKIPDILRARQVIQPKNPKKVYRSALTAADVLAVPGTVTCTLIADVGDLGSDTYYVKVVAGNQYGRTTPTAGNATVVTLHDDECVKAAFAAVVGATYYDIYCTTAANPLWVGRITEGQRASGIIIDGVGTTAAGGAVDSVYIYAIGTGLAADTTAAVNTAYKMPRAPVDCSGYQYADFDLTMSRTGDAVAAALTVTPFFYNERAGVYFAGEAEVIAFGGTAAAYEPLYQRLRIETRGNQGLALLVQSIAGTGASLDIDVTLS